MTRVLDVLQWILGGIFDAPAGPEDEEELRYHHHDPSLETPETEDLDPRDPDLEAYETTS